MVILFPPLFKVTLDLTSCDILAVLAFKALEVSKRAAVVQIGSLRSDAH